MNILQHSKLKQIPLPIWILIFFCYFIPVFIQFIVSDNLVIELESSIVWFLCLIPSVFISYYIGFKGGIYSVFFTIIVQIITELLDDKDQSISREHLFIMGEVSFANLLIIIPITTLIQKLTVERTNLKIVNEELTKKREQITNIFNNLDLAIWSLDMEKESLQISTGLEKLYGIPRDEFLKEPTALREKLIHPNDREIVEKLDKNLMAGKPGRANYRIIKPNGQERWVQDRAVPLVDKLGKVTRIDGVILDITDGKKAHDSIKKMAYHDPLTDLYNRRYFEEKLSSTIHVVKDVEEGQFAVLFIDLDGFKKVNDTLGHDTGDLLLQEVARRLRDCTRKTDTLARLAGDEFMILLPESHIKEAIEISEKIISRLQTPFIFGHNQAVVSPSIGISLYPEHGRDPKTLMKNADIAMYQVKNRGKNHYRIYNAGLCEKTFV